MAHRILLLGSQIVMFLIYLCFSKYAPKDDVSIRQQLKSAWWIVGFYVMMLIFSYLARSATDWALSAIRLT